MALWALGDLHLAFQSDKKMDIYGEIWRDHERKIAENCRRLVAPEDTLVLTGDHSWGRKLPKCEEDLDYIAQLPGRKILLRGNHDYFWDPKKTERLNEMYRGKLHFLQNNFYAYQDYALVGSKGYCFENLDSFVHFQSMQARETDRLEKSFRAAVQAGYRRFIVFLHYPPTSCLWPPTPELCRALGMSSKEEMLIRRQEEQLMMSRGWADNGRSIVVDLKKLSVRMQEKIDQAVQLTHSPFTEMAEAYGAEQIVYSHSHGEARFQDSLQGMVRGIRYTLVSGDYRNFTPVKILP